PVHAPRAQRDHLLGRLHPRHQGVLRRRPRRHRQPPRRPPGRPAPRSHGAVRPDAVRHGVARRRRVRPADPRPHDPADRNPGREDGEGPRMNDTTINLGVGDRIRLWWDALARPTQWAIGLPAFILVALLPVIRPAGIATVGTDFGGVMAQFGMYALIAIGLNVVVGQAGLLDLGYIGFYAI